MRYLDPQHICRVRIFPSENAVFRLLPDEKTGFCDHFPRENRKFSTQKVETPLRKAFVSQEKTFEDIFVKQLLKDLWPKRQQVSLASDIQDSSPAHLAYLMGEVEVLSTPSTRGQQHYNQVKLKPAPRIPHVLTVEQKKAFAFFKTYIPEFSDGFSSRELKKAFRTLARQLHPDTNESQDAGLFLLLKQAYQELSAIK